MTPGDPASPQTAEVEKALRRMEKYLSAVLRIGVAISTAFLLAGVVAMLIHHPDYLTDRGALAQLKTPGSALPPHGLGALAADLRQVRGRAMMTVGLLVLIATPVVRVVMSAMAFLTQRDWWFALITTLVFLVIMVSGFLGTIR